MAAYNYQPQTQGGYPYPYPNFQPAYSGPDAYDYKLEIDRKSSIGGPPPPTRLLKCICCMCVTFTLVSAAFIAAILIYFEPILPDYKINSLTSKPFNLSDKVTAEWDAGITFVNSNNKLHLFFVDFEIKLLFRYSTIGIGRFSAFHVGPKSEKVKMTKIVSNSVSLNQTKIDDMNWERSNRGSVKFEIRIMGKWSFNRPKDKKQKDQDYLHVQAICQDLDVGFDSNSTTGALIDGSNKSCEVIESS